jgi:hypothetical protein
LRAKASSVGIGKYPVASFDQKNTYPDWIWFGIQPKMLDPDQINKDPKH